jgi:tetratricopeptide (TPR) repeat protein
VHQSLGNATDALAAFERDPGFGRAHYNRANLLRDLGRAAEAEAGYERAIACDPSLAQAWNNLGLLRTAAGDLPGAEAALTQAIETGGLREARANRLLRLRATPPGHRHLAALPPRAPLPRAAGALPRARQATGDLPRAVESLSAAIDTPGAPVEQRIERAEALPPRACDFGAFDELGDHPIRAGRPAGAPRPRAPLP